MCKYCTVVYTCLSGCIFAHICTHAHTAAHTFVYVYIYIYTYTYKSMCMCIYTHEDVNVRRFFTSQGAPWQEMLPRAGSAEPQAPRVARAVKCLQMFAVRKACACVTLPLLCPYPAAPSAKMAAQPSHWMHAPSNWKHWRCWLQHRKTSPQKPPVTRAHIQGSSWQRTGCTVA